MRWLVATSIALAACGGDVVGVDAGAARDSGFDARVADAGIDAGTDAGGDGGVMQDAGADAGVDTGVEDAGIDAPVEPCGDGVRDASESCDLGIAPGDPGACPTGCTDCVCGRIVFMTSELHTGDLGGLAGADAICQRLAAAASLPGDYRAWLSDSSASPATRFTHAAVPYMTTNGGVVARDWDDLVDGALDRAVNVTESGVAIVVATAIYTATSAAGAHLGPDCDGWTDGTTALLGRRGNASFYTDRLWTDHSDGECAVDVHLFCVRQ